MEGGPSQFDLFSYKPILNKLAGQPPPASLLAGKRFAFTDPKAAVLLGTDPARRFKQYGQSGMWFSDLVPNLAAHADKICMLHGVVTSQFNHTPAQFMAQTGHNLSGYPAMGAWLNYGLGSENKNVPGYMVLNSAALINSGDTAWGSGFLPNAHGGVLLQPTGDPILNLGLPPGVSVAAERRRLDALQHLNLLQARGMLDPGIDARIENYELAFRMQAEAPGLTDLSQESPATLEKYGVNRTDADVTFVDKKRKPAAGTYRTFARHCLLARRLIERGVRFVNVFSGSWDSHSGLDTEVPWLARAVDQPIAALLQDLSDRGLLDETLVVWGSEFGRTPIGETRFSPATGRDHHPDAFSLFMAGGGIKAGVTYGETDDIGWLPTKDKTDISDIHATILRLFGIDHTALTYRFRGLDQRLTPVTRQAEALTRLFA